MTWCSVRLDSFRGTSFLENFFFKIMQFIKKKHGFNVQNVYITAQKVSQKALLILLHHSLVKFFISKTQV